jgi:metal-sulfur cluster biosynthetic enzyme
MPISPSSPVTQAEILAALRDVYDPRTRANIVELGLVHAISLAPDTDAPGSGISGVPPRSRVTIKLVSSDPGSDIEPQILALVENRLAAFPGISRTHVEFRAEPLWTPDRIAPELRQRLTAAIASNQRSDVLVQIQTAPAKSHSGS